jgi:hypothetical protein
MVVDLPEPVDPRIAECFDTRAFNDKVAAILSALDKVPTLTSPLSLDP